MLVDHTQVFVLYFYKHISNLIKEILRLGLIPGHGECIGTEGGVVPGISNTFCLHQDSQDLLKQTQFIRE